jgi:quercetin dioxygenase-like cupin family protein
MTSSEWSDDLKRIALKSRRQTKALFDPHDFLLWLRSHCPKQGTDWVKAILVTVKNGDYIAEHVHPEHTILYYVEPAGVPITIEGRTHLPKAGEVLYLEPGRLHGVPKNSGHTTRISVAMLVKED